MRVDRGIRGCRALEFGRFPKQGLTLALVVAIALAIAGSASATSGGASTGPKSSGSSHSRVPRGDPFALRGMWIWELARSDGGNLSNLIADARRYGVSTVFIKSGDGTSIWSQFNAPLLSTLHAHGLRVCAWQYVYGNHPITEAYVGAAAVKAGANCLVIDAESEYQGKYVAAQSYMTRLRDLIGANYPVSLAGFPYVDFHPGFPYSVFLGPGGAQYNTPQMYWADIGTTVDGVYSHTYEFNRIYERTIDPLGQTFNRPRLGQIKRFRQMSVSYGAAGVSWWDWQSSTTGTWQALSQPVGPLSGFTPDPGLATLGLHAQGDLVVWAQEHLVTAGEPITIDGGFGPQTQAAVETFQSTHGLAVDGVIGDLTWQALLRFAPAPVKWVHRGKRIVATAASIGHLVEPVPKSASLPSKRNEIAGAGGAGRPRH
jgi:peptidoglycan hydrolase-like protein with peptidoglycan-binding domain